MVDITAPILLALLNLEQVYILYLLMGLFVGNRLDELGVMVGTGGTHLGHLLQELRQNQTVVLN
jgi:hypothetical protein